MLKVTFIQHSCVLVETDTTLLLFDYYGGLLPALPQEKRFYVLNSHSHSDHYSDEIFRLGEQTKVPVTRYILSSDIRSGFFNLEDKEKVMYVKPHLVYTTGDLRLETLDSTDQGVAFWCRVDSRNIYHAGDLNDWFWDGDEEDRRLQEKYREEMKRLHGRGADVACIPFDPRLKEQADLGVIGYMQQADADCIVPIHCWNKFDVIHTVKTGKKCAAFSDRIVSIYKNNQVVLELET